MSMQVIGDKRETVETDRRPQAHRVSWKVSREGKRMIGLASLTPRSLAWIDR